MPASSEKIYKEWLSSKVHSAFTGNTSKETVRKGGKFNVWNGHISGKNLELKPFKKILQVWRTTDSMLKLTLEKSGKGTKLTLTQTNIPEGQADSYKQGWKDYYFAPMKKYFGSK